MQTHVPAVNAANAEHSMEDPKTSLLDLPREVRQRIWNNVVLPWSTLPGCYKHVYNHTHHHPESCSIHQRMKGVRCDLSHLTNHSFHRPPGGSADLAVWHSEVLQNFVRGNILQTRLDARVALLTTCRRIRDDLLDCGYFKRPLLHQLAREQKERQDGVLRFCGIFCWESFCRACLEFKAARNRIGLPKCDDEGDDDDDYFESWYRFFIPSRQVENHPQLLVSSIRRIRYISIEKIPRLWDLHECHRADLLWHVRQLWSAARCSHIDRHRCCGRGCEARHLTDRYFEEITAKLGAGRAFKSLGSGDLRSSSPIQSKSWLFWRSQNSESQIDYGYKARLGETRDEVEISGECQDTEECTKTVADAPLGSVHSSRPAVVIVRRCLPFRIAISTEFLIGNLILVFVPWQRGIVHFLLSVQLGLMVLALLLVLHESNRW